MSDFTNPIVQRLAEAKVVPVIALDRAEDAVPMCEALQAGGLQVAEITFRTKAAPEAIRLAAEAFPDFLIGAGTVTCIEELEQAQDVGAQFAVAPGVNPIILEHAQKIGLDFFPGVCTPSDVEAALQCGVNFLKFFPAEAAGGLKMLSALYGPYAHRVEGFMPTGGVNLGNLNEYLAHPAVACVGGTWIVPKNLLAEGNWSEIERLTREAVELIT
jgi:2-dehydro-3-deoxyphosphogluconate aldolase / (4S)-4-hydroxy-2-oxoglutarate aldolase